MNSNNNADLSATAVNDFGTAAAPSSADDASSSSVYNGISASGEARQHNGNVINNYAYTYTPKKRHTDQTLRENQRNNVLLKAAAEGQLPRIKYLLRLGTDIDHPDDSGYTALHHAALSGFEDCVSELIDEGADVNATSVDQETPLYLAATKRRLNVMHILVRAQANRDAALDHARQMRSSNDIDDHTLTAMEKAFAFFDALQDTPAEHDQ